jgi:hypothetical protein
MAGTWLSLQETSEWSTPYNNAPTSTPPTAVSTPPTAVSTPPTAVSTLVSTAVSTLVSTAVSTLVSTAAPSWHRQADQRQPHDAATLPLCAAGCQVLVHTGRC